MSILIKNGAIVGSLDTFHGDVLIEGEKISTLASGITVEADEIIDATGKLVIPGGIDVHTHFQLPVKGTVSADGFESGSRAAVYGGVTTFIDFAHAARGESLEKVLDERIEEATGESYIDFGLHMGVAEFNDHVKNEVAQCVKRGVPSFKLYMVYAGIMSDDAVIFGMLQAIKELGGLIIVHAENAALADYFTGELQKAGEVTIPFLPASRPDFVEIEAIRRVLYLTEITGSRVYVVHVSTGEGTSLISQAKGRGVSAFGETCPQYLLLTEAMYNRDEAHLYTCNPPFRTEVDQMALWKGLSMGALQVLSTDHCSFTREQKEPGRDDFTKVPNGLPGIETLLPLTFSEGVLKGRLSLNQWVDCISTNPAKMFGLFPHKGTLIPGADADVVVFDPEKTVELRPENLHYAVDYSPFTGMKVQGQVDVTISRGKVLMKDKELLGEKGWGKFVKRFYQEPV